MKILIFALLPIVISVTGQRIPEGTCDSDVKQQCTVGGEIEKCNAKYSGVHRVVRDLNFYARHHIVLSFQYLLMSINFANFEKNREGFEKLYRKLSDTTWEDGIKLMKYITKRGETVDLESLSTPNLETPGDPVMYEIDSLAKALELHKGLAQTGHDIHSGVTKRSDQFHDAETLAFLEKEFAGKHSEIIRKLAGYTNDVYNLIKGAKNSYSKDASLPIFLFDEYLKTEV